MENFPDVNRNDISRKNIELARRLLFFTGMQFYTVLYLVNGKERKTPWFRSEANAQKAFDIVTDKGYRAIIFGG